LDALNACLCSLVADPLSEGILKCKQSGCETQFYHPQCISLEWAPRNWACEVQASQSRRRMNENDVIFPKIDVCLIT
ncbi:hypothetical protein BDN70DRAFT_806380, partial [Pholiota conissans]